MPGIKPDWLLGKPSFEIESTKRVVTTPTSLLKLAIQYVSQHLELVESLVGFPEIVGELIFRAAESSCKFYYQNDEYHDCLPRLKLFTQAYGRVVLSKLSLSGRWSSLELYKDHVQIFRDLTDLELVECGLGDEDELLPHIGQHLTQLKYLSLRQNKLTDKGLVRLTTPYRVMGVGPRNLSLLNLSDNQEITGTGILKYLSAFEDLHEISITGTSVKRTEAVLKVWKFDIKKVSSTGPEVASFGWASDVVEKWAAQAEESLVLADNEQTATQKFYSNKRMNKERSSKLKGTFKKTVSGYNIVLSRIKEGVANTKDVSVCHKLPQRKDGNGESELGAYHPAKRGQLSSDRTKLHSDSDVTDPKRNSDSDVTDPKHNSDSDVTDPKRNSDSDVTDTKRNSDSDVTDRFCQDSEMMLGYLNTFKSVNLHRFPSEQIPNNDQECKEKTTLEIQLAKRRKIHICRQSTKSNDNHESECDTLNQEHFSKINTENFKYDSQVTQPTTNKKLDEEMTRNDLQIMMGYMGSKTVTAGDEQRPIAHSVFGRDLPVKQEAKRRFFDKGEAELMERSTKDSVRSLKRKKSLWKQMNSNTP